MRDLTKHRHNDTHSQKDTYRKALKAIKRSSAFIMNSLHHYCEINYVTFQLQRPSSFHYKASHSQLNKYGHHHRLIISQHESE